jgi:hypothetical protein
MAIFGRAFPFPRRYVNHLVGPASTVRANIVRPVRLADRGRPFPHVTIKGLVGPPTTVGPKYVRPIKLLDRPRAKLGVIVGKALPSVSNVTLTAAPGSFILTGIAAQFIISQFASPPVHAVRLPDRPRPFPHVTIKTALPAVSNVTLAAAPGSFILSGIAAQLTLSRFASPVVRPVKLLDRPRPFAHVFISRAPPAAVATTMPAAPGAFALTGVAATLNIGIVDAVGAFTLTGVTAVLNPALVAGTGAFTLTGIAAALTVGGSPTMAAGIGAFILTGNPAGLLAPSIVRTFPEGTLWGYWREKPSKRRRKPTLLEILADVIEADQPPKPPVAPSRRDRARGKAAAQRWAEEIVARAQQEARSCELDYAKPAIAAALREHAATLIEDAVQRRLDQEEEEAILLLLSHYH